MDKDIKFVAESVTKAKVGQNDVAFDKGDTKSQVFKSFIGNDKNLTKKCLEVKKDTKMTLDSKYYASLIENSESFERGDNIAKTTIMLAENNEKLTGLIIS